jgi:hypothetical protein
MAATYSGYVFKILTPPRPIRGIWPSSVALRVSQLVALIRGKRVGGFRERVFLKSSLQGLNADSE